MPSHKATFRSKFFLLLVPLMVVCAGVILYLSSQTSVFDSSCGCGPPPPDFAGEFQKEEKIAIFNNQPVRFLMAEIPPSREDLEEAKGAVLGAATGERWIEIDLSDQKLYAHNGPNIDYQFKISSGKWAPTPTGEFRIWGKYRYTKMEGGEKGRNTYYYLPNVPYTQYFFKGYGIHGAYWHNNFGQPMSHGCINLAVLDAEKLFYWTSPALEYGKSMASATSRIPGTKVIIHE